MTVIEDFKSSNISKSAKETSDQHGRNVRVQSDLNRSILDQGLYEMHRQLEYKPLWLGDMVFAVPLPALRQLRAYSEREPPATKSICVSGMLLHFERRYKRST